MREIAELLHKIGNTSSRNDKISLLKQGENIVGFEETLQFIFDPYIVTNIADKKLEKNSHTAKLKSPITIYRIIEYYTNHRTGTQYDCIEGNYYINGVDTELEKWLVKCMITKTMKIGVTAKTLNAVYGKDFIKQIGVMLGTNYQDVKNPVGPFIVTEKLDGGRCLLVKDRNNVTCYSRSGKIIEGLVDIEAQAAHLPTGYVYDGECLAIGEFEDSIAQRQATNSIMASKGIKLGISYNIFDLVPLNEFVKGCSTEVASTRKRNLATMFGQTNDSFKVIPALRDNPFIKAVPILGYAHTEEEVMVYAQNMWSQKKEGVMLNSVNSLYEIKRSKHLLKVKDVQSLDLPIIGFQEGTGKYKGMLGAFWVNYKNFRVSVGSGLTDKERVEYWRDRTKLIGTLIEVNTFGETKNKNNDSLSLNAPIFRGLRWDKIGVD